MSLYDSGIWSPLFGAYAIATCALVAALRHFSKKKISPDNPKLTEVQAQISALRQKVHLLDEHTTTYFQTLTEAGFPHLQDTLKALQTGCATIEVLTSSGKIKEARALTEWMANQSAPAPLESTLTVAVRQRLQDWQENSRLLLMACTDALAKTAEQNASIGLERSTKRRPTSMSLEKLRQLDSETQ
jgi:hypothetical protein